MTFRNGLAKKASGSCLRNDRYEASVVGDACLLVAVLSHGAQLGAVASGDCEIGLVAYEMTLLVARIGEILSPDLIDERKDLLSA